MARVAKGLREFVDFILHTLRVGRSLVFTKDDKELLSFPVETVTVDGLRILYRPLGQVLLDDVGNGHFVDDEEQFLEM